jgi:hypothetical protein
MGGISRAVAKMLLESGTKDKRWGSSNNEELSGLKKVKPRYADGSKVEKDVIRGRR